jgi:MFS family permease
VQFVSAIPLFLSATASINTMGLLRDLTDFIERPRFLYAVFSIWSSITAGCFLSPFLEHVGLEESQIGLALSLARLFEMLGSAFAGSWADRRESLYPKHGRAQVMALGIVGGSAATLCHAYMNRAWQHIALRCLYSGFGSMVLVVLDGTTIEYLGDEKADYGKERLHGAIWWALAHLALSFLVEFTGFNSIYLLTMISGPCVILCLCVYVSHQTKERPKLLMKLSSTITSSTDDGSSSDEEENEPYESYQATTRPRALSRDFGSAALYKAEVSLIDLARMLLISFQSVAFFIAVFCLASGQGIADSFSFLFFESLGSSYIVMGWTVVLTVAFEIPVFNIAPKLLQRYGSSKMLVLATAFYIIRVTGYSLIPAGQGWMVLLFEPMHGVAFACTQTSIVDYVSHLVPLGYQASGQGLAACFRGMGGMFGVGLGGLLAQESGDRLVYRLAAGVVAMGSLVFILSKCLARRKVMDVMQQQSLPLHHPDEIHIVSNGNEQRPLMTSRLADTLYI